MSSQPESSGTARDWHGRDADPSVAPADFALDGCRYFGVEAQQALAELEKAKGIFQTFLDKAAGKPEYDGAVKRVKGDGSKKDLGRMGDIDDTIAFDEQPQSKNR